jgi:hypothetical protein
LNFPGLKLRPLISDDETWICIGSGNTCPGSGDGRVATARLHLLNIETVPRAEVISDLKSFRQHLHEGSAHLLENLFLAVPSVFHMEMWAERWVIVFVKVEALVHVSLEFQKSTLFTLVH